jgi:hypothetical protein
MDANPLVDGDLSDGENSSASSSSSSASLTGSAPVVTTPSTAVLQTVNIKSHIPVVLELTEPNYAEWRTFFDAFIGKFGLTDHLSTPPTKAQRRDPDWRLLDQCILSWLYNSVAKDVLAIVRLLNPRRTPSGLASRSNSVTTNSTGRFIMKPSSGTWCKGTWTSPNTRAS